MEQSQLVELIKTLSPKEKELVLQFASIDFFNHGRMRGQVGGLLRICLSFPWQDVSLRLDKSELYLTLFPDQKFVEGKLEKVMVEAHKLIQLSLLTQEYFTPPNQFNQTYDLSKIILNRQLGPRYDNLLYKLANLQSSTFPKNESYYFQQFQLEYAIHDLESIRNQKKGDLNVPKVLYSLEMHFFLNRFALLNRILLQKKYAKIELDPSLVRLISESEVPTKYLIDSPILKIYYTIFTILCQENTKPEDVELLLLLLKEHEALLNIELLREFYTYLRNICVLVLIDFPEHEAFNFTLHELYKDNLVRGYLHYEGKMHSSRYLAISVNAARIGNFEWALDFINKYRDCIIGENETSDIYRLNLANYYFGIGRFGDCLDNIPPTSPFVDYLLHGKRLELKTLYELRSDFFNFKLDSFKMFLCRTSIKLLSEMQRFSNTDFANMLDQILRSRPGDKKRSETLIKRIEEKKQAAEYRWLLSKARELATKGL